MTLLVVGLISIMALFVACGGGDSSSDSAGSNTSSAPAATTESAGPTNAELIAIGEKEFSTCAGCHGQDGTGITGLGKSFVGSEFIRDTSDADLIALITNGRPSSDPLNTTGIDMPPKGGNPALTEEKIKGLVAFVRSLQ
jgi:disulfide bond formation protein DsbB